METSLVDFQYERYRRVPMNSATTQKDITEFNSIGTHSTYSSWSRSNKILRTTYIDGTTMLGLYDRPYDIKDLFPKGKNRQKPLHRTEKKDARDAYMSLLPTDTSTVRSEKNHSPSRMGSATQSPYLPEVSPKSANTQNQRTLRATIFDDSSESKFYASYATTHANGAWVRRYKSINESQILTNLLRDPSYEEKILLKKRPYQQLYVSSSSSFTPSLNKRRREKCS